MTNAELVGGLPQISLIGTPRAIGEALGTRLKPRLQVLSEYLIEYLAQHAFTGAKAMTADDVRAITKEALPRISDLEPGLAMELESCSRTSGLPPEDLLVIHGYTDLLCGLGAPIPTTPSTYVAIPASHTLIGTPLQVLVWECDPVLLPYVSLVHRIPSHGPASLSLTLAGLHPIAFINEAGISVASNAMPIKDSEPGHFTTHILAAMTTAPAFEDALSRAKRSPRWGGRAIHLMAANGQRETVEVSGSRMAILPDPNQTVVRVHTNHPLAEDLKPVTHDDPFSRVRLEQVASAAVRARQIEPPHVTTWFGLDNESSHGGSLGVDTTARRKRGLVANPDGCITVIIDPAQRCVYLRKGRGAPLERKTL